MQITIEIKDDYITPEGDLTTAQYVERVMNFACISYKNQWGGESIFDGLEAAKDNYNATREPPTE